MKKQYTIYLKNTEIGYANVEKSGLYWQFFCRCKPRTDAPLRIMVTCGKKTEDLGICVPNGDTFEIYTRIPLKRLEEGEFQFYAEPKCAVQSHRFISLYANEPFLYLAELNNAQLQAQDDQIGVILPV